MARGSGEQRCVFAAGSFGGCYDYDCYVFYQQLTNANILMYILCNSEIFALWISLVSRNIQNRHWANVPYLNRWVWMPTCSTPYVYGSWKNKCIRHFWDHTFNARTFCKFSKVVKMFFQPRQGILLPQQGCKLHPTTICIDARINPMGLCWAHLELVVVCWGPGPNEFGDCRDGKISDRRRRGMGLWMERSPIVAWWRSLWVKMHPKNARTGKNHWMMRPFKSHVCVYWEVMLFINQDSISIWTSSGPAIAWVPKPRSWFRHPSWQLVGSETVPQDGSQDVVKKGRLIFWDKYI